MENKRELKDNEKEILQKEGYTFIRTYRETKNKRNYYRMEIIHNLCGKQYTCRIDRFFKEGQRCSCLRKNSSSSLSIGDDDAFEEMFPEFFPITKYMGRKKEITVQHKPCGFIYTLKRAEYLYESTKCPVCYNGVMNTTASLNYKFQNMFGLNIELAEPYKSGAHYIKIKDNRCGHVYEAYLFDIVNNQKCICPLCRTKYKKDITIDYVKEEVKKLDANYEVLSAEYKSTHEPLLFKHLNCGTEYFASRNNFVCVGRRCPYCAQTQTTSKEELELLSFIHKFYPSAKKEKINGIEIDIYIPELKIGIEFNGLYWHSNNTRKGKAKDHQKKMLALNKLGINVINIFEDDWCNNQEKTKQKILSILKKENIKTDEIIELNLCEEFISNYPDYEVIKKIPPEKLYIDENFMTRVNYKTNNFVYDCGKIILKKL